MTPWQQQALAKLRAGGLTQKQIKFVLELLVEHRMAADAIGYERGYEHGWERSYLLQSGPEPLK